MPGPVTVTAQSPTALSISLPISSFLSPPKSFRNNRSFTNLVARIIGIGGGSKSEIEAGTLSSSFSDNDANEDDNAVEEEDHDGDNDNDTNEHALLWKAQTALISHQTAVAAAILTTAALPPHRSPAACLNLGNLIARGEALADPDNSAIATYQRRLSTARETLAGSAASTSFSPPSKWLTFFRSPTLGLSSPPNSHSQQSSETINKIEQAQQLVYQQHQSLGWALVKEGKRVVRDVQRMGKAGGWFVLGIGWIIDQELARQKQKDHRRRAAAQHTSRAPVQLDYDNDKDDAGIFFGRKGKGRTKSKAVSDSNANISAQHVLSSTGTVHQTNERTANSISAEKLTATQSLSTGESTVLKTPRSSQSLDGDEEEDQIDEEIKRIRLLYDLFTPLILLYRHGHIQSHDPVALPPISSSELPTCLKPQGDQQKGRNVYALGAVVSALALKLQLLEKERVSNEDGITAPRCQAVLIMANYIMGITARPHTAATYFRAVLELGTCGLEVPDQLVRQASKRLDIALQTPEPVDLPTEQAQPHYPFPKMTAPKVEEMKPQPELALQGIQPRARPKAGATAASRPSHARQTSGASIMSFTSFKGRVLSHSAKSAKSTISLASLAIGEMLDKPERASGHLDTQDALTSLRMLQRRDESTRRHAAIPNFTPTQSALEQDMEVLAATEEHEQSEDQRLDPSLSTGQSEKTNRGVLPTLKPFWPFSSTWTSRTASRVSIPLFASVEEDAASHGGITPLNITEVSSSLPVVNQISTDAIRAQPALVPANAYRPIPPAPATAISSSLRTIASSPQLFQSQSGTSTVGNSLACPTMGTLSKTRAHASTVALRRLPLEPDEKDRINPIDPVLAAAELASTLTKHATCSVCGANGVNFPECRKCGLIFCSRSCRVDERKAGNGKRHICGAWESRQLLQVSPGRSHGMSTVRRTSQSPVCGSPQATPRVKAH